MLDNADAQLSDGTELISPYGYHVDYDWIGTHDVGIDFTNTDFNQSLAEVIVDDPGFGYSVPIEVKSWGVPRAWDRNPASICPRDHRERYCYIIPRSKIYCH